MKHKKFNEIEMEYKFMHYFMFFHDFPFHRTKNSLMEKLFFIKLKITSEIKEIVEDIEKKSFSYWIESFEILAN